MFHHDPSLSGVFSPFPDLGTVTPVDVTAPAGDAQVSLSWTAPSASGAGERVQRLCGDRSGARIEHPCQWHLAPY